MQTETYISVDVETAGPTPGKYSLLSIGACLVDDISQGFYVELKPDMPDFTMEAKAIHGLSIPDLQTTGLDPQKALLAFSDWVKDATPAGCRPIFVAFNAPFDWMFINEYFVRYQVHNPFGHSALDIKAYFMGQMGVSWGETSLQHISAHFLDDKKLSHNALEDAQVQGEIFHLMLKTSQRLNADHRS